MTISVTSLGATDNKSTGTLALLSATIPQHALIFVFAAEPGTITGDGTCGDPTNGATSYTKLNSAGLNNNLANGYGIAFYFKDSAGFTGQITYNKNLASNCAMFGLYAQGLDNTSPLDTTFTATATGNTASPTVTSAGAPAIAGSLLIGAAASGSSTAHPISQDAGNGWTDPLPTTKDNANKDTEIVGAYQTSSIQRTYNPTTTGSQPWAAFIYAFKPPDNPIMTDRGVFVCP